MHPDSAVLLVKRSIGVLIFAKKYGWVKPELTHNVNEDGIMAGFSTVLGHMCYVTKMNAIELDGVVFGSPAIKRVHLESNQGRGWTTSLRLYQRPENSLIQPLYSREKTSSLGGLLASSKVSRTGIISTLTKVEPISM